MSKNQEAIDQPIMLKATQQQFERMNLIFGEIQDKLERQDIAIANIQRGQQPIALNVKNNHGCATIKKENGDDKIILMNEPPLTCVEEMIEGQDV